jgi:uncharacterized membrane protein YoaK (UPF0700 family)
MGRSTILRFDALTACGGFVDAVGFVTLFGLFTSHLSGDTTHLAVDLGRWEEHGDATARVAVLAAFVVAVVVATLAVGLAGRPSSAHRGLLLTQGLLLVGMMLVGDRWLDEGALRLGSPRVAVLAAAAGAAMGIQNAVVRAQAAVPVTTTFVTGALASFGDDLAVWLRDRTDQRARRRLARHGFAWLAFLVGGVAGATAATAWHFWAFGIPAAAILVLATLPQPVAAS